MARIPEVNFSQIPSNNRALVVALFLVIALSLSSTHHHSGNLTTFILVLTHGAFCDTGQIPGPNLYIIALLFHGVRFELWPEFAVFNA